MVEASASATAAAVRARAKVLVINDSPAFLDLMEELLTSEGVFEVATLDQSEGVIEEVTARPPQLIILDIVFRYGRSGLDVAEELSASADAASIPILFCTALAPHEIPDDTRQRIDGRGQRILHKPFDIAELLAHVEELLEPVQ